MKKILITGGTGLIGTVLSRLLRSKGFEVSHLSRRANPNAEFPAYRWDLESQTIYGDIVEQADAIIHLAGASLVDKRWTESYKKVILDSRTKSLQLIHKYIKKRSRPLKTLVSASAVGFYGDAGDRWLEEDAPPAPPQSDDFKSLCCVLWEEAAKALEPDVGRLAIIRVGIVLSTKGGALEKIAMSFKARVGSYFGDGQAYYPWIHIDDMARMFAYAVEQENVTGIYNGVAPNPVTNKEFVQTIPKALDIKAAIVPTPEIAIKLAMGEMATVVLHSNRVSAQKIQQSGFVFDHQELLPALKDVFEREV